MEVIRQIATHLARQGMLSRDERSWLAREGFVGWYDVFPEDETPSRTDASSSVGEEPARHRQWVEQWENDGFDRTGGRRRANRQASSAAAERALTVKDLVATLRTEQQSWARNLQGLVLLAAEVGARPADWQGAVEIIRQCETRLLERAVISLMQVRQVAFTTLWKAMACEPYADVVLPERAHGQVARGYEAVIHSLNQPHLGRHAGLLRHREIAVVAALRQAQRKSLAACEPLLGAYRNVLDRIMSQKTLAACYWTFVIAYSARRGGRGSRPAPGSDERRPVRAEPNTAVWRHAWEGAAILDPRSVGPFLIDYLAGGKPQRDGLPPFIGKRLACPAAWTQLKK